MSILGSVLPLLPDIYKFLKKVLYKIGFLAFRIRNRKPALNESNARRIASSVLAGHIVKVISYRNIGSKHIFLTGVRCSSVDDHDYQVYVLEQFGNNYRVIWKSEPIIKSNPPSVQVVDIDKDEIKEIIFIDESFGTGAGLRVMYIYSTFKNQLFQIMEKYDWQDAAGPISPQIEIVPEPDKEFSRAIEQYALKQGYLKDEFVDLNKPEYAVQKWHTLNGVKRKGMVKLFFYDNRPKYGASISATLETTDIIWIAYFKGPLYGYIKKRNQHFVAYSPSWIYNCITCLAYDGESLWFGAHSDFGLFSFKFEQTKGYLNYYTHYNNKEFGEVVKIELSNDEIIINGNTKIYSNELRELET